MGYLHQNRLTNTLVIGGTIAFVASILMIGSTVFAQEKPLRDQGNTTTTYERVGDVIKIRKTVDVNGNITTTERDANPREESVINLLEAQDSKEQTLESYHSILSALQIQLETQPTPNLRTISDAVLMLVEIELLER